MCFFFEVLLEGRPERGPGNSVAIFEIHIVPGYCIGWCQHPLMYSPVYLFSAALSNGSWLSLLFLSPECNFEEHHLCGYSNSWNPNVNWYVGGSVAQEPESNLPVNHTNSQRGEHGLTH